MNKNKEIIVLEPNKEGVYEDTGKIEKTSPKQKLPRQSKRRPKQPKQTNNPPIVQFLNGFSEGANLINILRRVINGKF